MAKPTVVRMLGLGGKIRKYRSAAGLTQRKMAKLLNIPYSTYSNYENDNRTPDADTLEKICNILNISMVELVGKIVAPCGNGLEMPVDREKAARGYRLNQINTAFYMLNEKGQEIAVQRMQELTKIPEYQEKEPE